MFLIMLTTTTLLHMIADASLFTSGAFLVRISSMKQQRIRYCFTELPYRFRGTSDGPCLKSGQLDVTNRTETVLDLRLPNLTSAYLTIVFDISDMNGVAIDEQSQKFKYRVMINGALPSQRTAVTNGLVFDFLTVCKKPYHGLMCAQYCVDDVDAHYVCDSSGDKVCLSGWTGKDCTIASNGVFPTSVDDIITPSSTQSLTSKGSSGKSPPNRRSTVLKPTLNGPDTSPTSFTSTSRFVQPATTRPPVRKVPTLVFSTRTLEDVVVHTRPMSQPSSTARPIASSSTSDPIDDEITTVLTTSSAFTSSASGRYSISRMSTVLLFLTSIATVIFLLRKFIQSSWMQNFLNNCRAVVSMFENVRGPRRRVMDEKTPKMFVVDVKRSNEKLAAVYENEQLNPRYSLQPSRKKYGKQLSMNDTSSPKSNSYHEIDSFLVLPVVEAQLGTLV